MAVLDAIKNRYSCRSYLDKPVEQNKLDEILEAARIAPSAKNLQDWRFIVVTDKDKKRRLAAAANDQKFFENAGAIIVACSVSDYVMLCGQPIGPIDIAIALENICLQAAQLGLATCWIGSFFPEKVRPILGIPDDVAVIELLALGYPADKPAARTARQPLGKIVSYEKWQF